MIDTELFKASKLVYEYMKTKTNSLIDAYNHVKYKYNIDFSYDEVKDFMFHYDFESNEYHSEKYMYKQITD